MSFSRNIRDWETETRATTNRVCAYPISAPTYISSVTVTVRASLDAYAESLIRLTPNEIFRSRTRNTTSGHAPLSRRDDHHRARVEEVRRREAPADAPPRAPARCTCAYRDRPLQRRRGRFEQGRVLRKSAASPCGGATCRSLTSRGRRVGAPGAKTLQSLTCRRQALPRERRRNPRTETKTKTPRRFPRRGGSTSAGS